MTRRYGCDASVRLTATNHSTGGGQTPVIGVGRLVHEGGWTLTGTATDHRITRPDGTRVPAAAVNGHDASWKPPDLETWPTPAACTLRPAPGSGTTNYVVDVAWTVNDHHRKRFRGTVTVAN